MANESHLHQQLHHARHIRDDVPYHVLSKTLRGLFYLLPRPEFNRILIGVVGKAQANWPEVKLFGYAFLTNHFHLMLQGNAQDVALFVGFVKGEASRRVGQRLSLPGTIWHKRYDCSALPTEKSQIKCLEYILSQGVKEDLVERPEQWPGVHCAKQFVTGRKPKGYWLDGTAYGKAKHAILAKGLKPRLKKKDYQHAFTIELTQIPAWAHLSKEGLPGSGEGAHR